MTTHADVKQILNDAYGEGAMVNSLAAHLAHRIDTFGSRERMILETCWDWFPGGDTAETVARKIESAIGGDLVTLAVSADALAQTCTDLDMEGVGHPEFYDAAARALLGAGWIDDRGWWEPPA